MTDDSDIEVARRMLDKNAAISTLCDMVVKLRAEVERLREALERLGRDAFTEGIGWVEDRVRDALATSPQEGELGKQVWSQGFEQGTGSLRDPEQIAGRDDI